MVATKVVECLSVRLGDSLFGPGSQNSALEEFFKNPVGEVVLELFDDEGGSGRISVKMGDDEKLILSLDLENFGYQLRQVG